MKEKKNPSIRKEKSLHDVDLLPLTLVYMKYFQAALTSTLQSTITRATDDDNIYCVLLQAKQ